MKNEKKLYPYQENSVNKAMKSSICKIIIPTGGGKGVICREIFFRYVSNSRNKNNNFLGLVFTPRLILNKQWVVDFVKYFENQKHPLTFIFVGSEKMTKQMMEMIEQSLFKINGQGVDAPVSTMKSSDVKKAVENNKRKGINTIVISTYHSNNVIRKTNLYFDCIIYDEAHYLPGREDPRGIQRDKDDLFNATKIDAKNKIFTTATEKIGNVSDIENYCGRGMNNFKIYGEEILIWKDSDGFDRRVSPRDLIEFGAILEPLVHVISTDIDLSKYGIKDNLNNIHKVKIKNPINEREFNEKFKLIKFSFLEHEKVIKSRSSFPDEIGAKVMVVSNGSAEMEGILSSNELKKFKKDYPDVKLYFISSKTGINMPGYEQLKNSNSNKEKFLESIKSLKNNDRAIIFHIDILTCGIDVYGLTGVMFFRNCKEIKTLQNLGRACRLHEIDRKKWEKGLLKPNEDGYIKPNFYIILPVLFSNTSDFIQEFSKTINSIRIEYDFKSFEFVHVGGYQPANISSEDENGIITLSKDIKSKLERDFYQEIEEVKKIKKEEKNKEEENYINQLIKEKKEDELDLYLDGL